MWTNSPDELGFIQPHEHTLIDSLGDPGNPDRNYYDTNRIIFEESLVINELKYFTDAGGKSIVYITNIGLGRNPEGVKRISEASGVNIISFGSSIGSHSGLFRILSGQIRLRKKGRGS